MMYWTCPYCNANLDFGEKCNCQNDCNREARHGDDKLTEKEIPKYGKLHIVRSGCGYQ